MNKQHYTLGFMFSEDRSRVLLIKKNRPHYHAGLYNGLGGKVEDGETGIQTMTREFYEEAGFYFDKWRRFCTLRSATFTDSGTVPTDWSIEVFKGFGDIDKAKSMTDEEVAIFDVNKLPNEIVTNSKWLIHMALQNDTYTIEEENGNK